MSEPSNLRSSNPLTSFAADSPVNPSRSPGAESDKTMNDGSGLSLLESFATCNLDGYSSKTSPGSSPATGPKWKTRQRTLFGDQACQTFSESWPAAGMTRNGIAYRLPRSVPRISVTGPSSLPTLTVNGNNNWKGSSATSQDGLTTKLKALTLRASDGKSGPQQQRKRGTGKGSHHGGNLAAFLPTLSASMMTLADMEQAKYAGNDPNRPKYAAAGSLPTLQARDYRSGKTRTSYGNSRPLNEVLPTLLSSDAKGSLGAHRGDGRDKRNLAREIPRRKSTAQDGGPLNPAWCEWYMGFPIGWTELEDSETPSSPKSRSGSAAKSSKRNPTGVRKPIHSNS